MRLSLVDDPIIGSKAYRAVHEAIGPAMKWNIRVSDYTQSFAMVSLALERAAYRDYIEKSGASDTGQRFFDFGRGFEYGIAAAMTFPHLFALGGDFSRSDWVLVYHKIIDLLLEKNPERGGGRDGKQSNPEEG